MMGGVERRRTTHNKSTLAPNNNQPFYTHKSDLVLNAIFTMEMLLRVVALGGPLAYLSQPWNVFDGAMVAAGYTTFIPMGGDGGAGLEGVRALRALRALRPLRTITR